MVSVNIHVGCMFTYNNTENLYAGHLDVSEKDCLWFSTQAVNFPV